MIEIKTKSEFFDDDTKRLEVDTLAIYETLTEIQKEIKSHKDKALRFFTEKFDHVKLSNVIVTKEEINDAKKVVSKDFIEAIKIAKENITTFHQNQLPFNWKEESHKILSH